MKTELNTECHISNLNDLQENKKENPIEKKNARRRHYVFPQSKNVRRSTYLGLQ